MRINISGVIGNSYSILFKNRTVLVLCIIGAIIGTVFNSLFMVILTTMLYQPSAAFIPVGVPTPTPQISFDFVALILIAIVLTVFILVNLFIEGAVISAVSLDSKAEIGASVKKALSRYISLIGASIATSFISFISLLPGIILIVSMYFEIMNSGAIAGIVPLVLGMLLLIMPGMYVDLRISLSEVACIAGGKRAIDSVKSSWSITKGNLWSILAITLILGIIEGIVGAFFSWLYTPVGVFVQAMLAYPITIAFVLVYQQMQTPARAAKKPKK